jgi:hypothetical protein
VDTPVVFAIALLTTWHTSRLNRSSRPAAARRRLLADRVPFACNVRLPWKYRRFAARRTPGFREGCLSPSDVTAKFLIPRSIPTARPVTFGGASAS